MMNDDVQFSMVAKDSIEKIIEDADIILEVYERNKEVNSQMFSGMWKIFCEMITDQAFIVSVLSLAKRVERLEMKK